MSRLQEDVLHVVQSYAPVTTKGVCYHLLLDYDHARNALAALERKGLIGRNYTCHIDDGSRFAYEPVRVWA